MKINNIEIEGTIVNFYEEKNYYNCIYLYINTINGKGYIGKAVNFKNRHKPHMERDLVIDKAIKKYGIEKFNVYILIENLKDNEEMNYYEKHYIAYYGTYKYGYNLTKGGDGGNVMEKWSDDRKEEFRVKMSSVTKGKNNGWYGAKADDDLRKRISDSHKGLQYPSRYRTLAQYDLNGNLIKIWEKRAVYTVAHEMNISDKGLYRCINKDNPQQTCGGYIWIAVDEMDEVPVKIEPPKYKNKKKQNKITKKQLQV